MIETTKIIHGVRPSRLTADERETTLIRRAWTRAERRVVLAGFFGRLAIAVEPLLCGIVFAFITLGVFWAPRISGGKVLPDIIVIAPVFGLGVVGCAIWLVGVMAAPVRALAHTLRPIYVVDGYIRFRRRDVQSALDTNGYVAVLIEDGRVACEWPTLGTVELPDEARPALCEFTEYGGVHAIDGRPTGVLPGRIPALGVSIHGRKEEIV
ncbi:MAG TPA: hypothetical protein VHT53_06710 [Candidatus Elarobacter sp.]|nr:hypothetical protein [Candidatus Elarobacter sp.]